MAGWLAAGLRAPDVSPCPSLLTYPPYINWLVGSVPRIPRNLPLADPAVETQRVSTSKVFITPRIN